MAEKKRKPDNLKIEIPEQGISVNLANPDEASAWFSAQLEFWSNMRPRIGGTITIGSTNVPTEKFFRTIDAVLTNARKSAFGEDKTPLDEFVAYARDLRLIVAGGSIERAMARDATGGVKEDLLGYLFAYCTPFWPSEIRAKQGSIISIAGAITAGHPAAALLKKGNDLSAAGEAIEEIWQTKQAMDTTFAQSSTDLQDLRARYEAHISLKAPATYWDRRRRSARNIAIAAAAAFLLVLGGLGFLAWLFAGDALSFLEAHSPGLTIVNGLLVVVVPILAAAWILRHISRVLVQNINNANDAAFRKALVETFLSIAQELKQGLAEQDRALIFNALFRPGPGEPQDEGPPAGVIDLLLKRPS